MNISYLKTLALVPVFVIFAACSTTSTSNTSDKSGTTPAASTQDKIEKALPYVKPAVSLACSAVLEAAVSPSDRVEKARMIHDVAQVIRSLSAGAVPSTAELDQAIANFLPEKTHWTGFAQSLTDVYANLFRQIGNDPKLALKVLNAIADGCVSATASYVP